MVMLCLYNKNIILAAPTLRNIKNAIDVFKDKRKNLTQLRALPGLHNLPQYTIMAAAVDDLGSIADSKSTAGILKNTKMLALLLGEQKKKVKLNINLTAVSVNAAEQMKQMINGIKAVFALGASGSDPKAADLINHIKVAGDGHMVNISLDYPINKLFETIKKLNANVDITVNK